MVENLEGANGKGIFVRNHLELDNVNTFLFVPSKIGWKGTPVKGRRRMI